MEALQIALTPNLDKISCMKDLIDFVLPITVKESIIYITSPRPIQECKNVKIYTIY